MARVCWFSTLRPSRHASSRRSSEFARAEFARAVLWDRERILYTSGKRQLKRLNAAADFLTRRIREAYEDEGLTPAERACLVTVLAHDFGYDCPGPGDFGIEGKRISSCENRARNMAVELDLELEKLSTPQKHLVFFLSELGIILGISDQHTRLAHLVLVAALCRWLETRCGLPRLPRLPTSLRARDLLKMQVLRMRVDFLLSA